MEYRLKEREFRKLLEERMFRYPNTSDYLYSYCLYSISSMLSSWTRKIERQIEEHDSTYWDNCEEMLSDILEVTQLKVEQLFQLEFPFIEDVRDFEHVHKNLYETIGYPIKEHLNYIQFEPALERKRFILKQLNVMDLEETTFCDLGFGPGVLMTMILKERTSWKGYGVDISHCCANYAKRMLEIKELSQRGELCVADVRQLPYEDESFDLAIGVEVFEHIPNPEVGLHEMVRVLKPGGYAITALPVGLPIPMHLYVFNDTQEVLSLYKKVGLEVKVFEAKEFKRRKGKFVDTFALVVRG